MCTYEKEVIRKTIELGKRNSEGFFTKTVDGVKTTYVLDYQEEGIIKLKLKEIVERIINLVK